MLGSRPRNVLAKFAPEPNVLVLNGVEFQTNLRIHLLARSRLSIEGRTEGASKLHPASRRLLSYGSVSCGPILGLCIRNPMLWGFHFKYRSIVAAKSRTRRCRP